MRDCSCSSPIYNKVGKIKSPARWWLASGREFVFYGSLRGFIGNVGASSARPNDFAPPPIAMGYSRKL